MAVIAQPAHFAAPVGGWNALDAIAAMPATDAVRLDNLFPETSYLRLRRGSQTWGGLGGNPVRSLMTFAHSTLGDRLLAASNGTLYDQTNPLAAVPIGTGAGDRWEYVNFSTPAGQFWVAVNGNAQQFYWNGSGTITAGVNTQGPLLSHIPAWSMITAFQSRLFFAGTTDLYLYYLPVNVLQGEVHGIDLGSYFVLGGQIAFLGTWTRDDSTLGMNDLLVIGTTHGEIIVYRGVDPDDPSNWFMVGRFETGRPVSGHRQLCRLGPDMMLVNEDGFQGLANYLAMGESKALTSAISRKIGNAVTAAVRVGRDFEGWCAILYPTKNALWVNVPQTDGTYQQYVVNTITGSWCRFIGLQAICWTLAFGRLFFGTNNGLVVQADVGGNDDGRPIAFDLCTSFQVFANIMQQKRATMVRPFIIASGQWHPAMDVNTDYTLTDIFSPVAVDSYETAWDQFNWDQANWASSGTPQHYWYSVQGIGTAFAIRMTGVAMSAQLQLMALDLTYEAAIGFV